MFCRMQTPDPLRPLTGRLSSKTEGSEDWHYSKNVLGEKHSFAAQTIEEMRYLLLLL